MTSRENLEKINIQEGKKGVLLEGNLGEVKEITLIEDRLLELNCTNGAIRLNITRDELLKALTKKELTKKEKFGK
jgi:hypothetical protein